MLGMGLGIVGLPVRQRIGGPSLNLDFVGATALDPRVDFTRGSEATGWVNGQLKTFGIDEPRFVTDPVTGEALGLLVEGQATNFVDFSESNFAYTTSAIVVYDYTSSPSGMTDATLIYGDSANVYARPQGQQTLISGRDYVASVFCKPMGINSSRAAVWLPGSVFNDSASGNGPQCRINPDGSIETWGDPDRYGVEELADGWYRVWVSHKAIHTATPNNLMRFWPVFARSDPEDGWLFWGMQMEEGIRPTSYIPTEGSQVTRAADSTIIPTNAFPFNWRAGTLVFDRGDAPFTSSRFPVVIGQGPSNYLGLDYNSSIIAYLQPFAGSIPGSNSELSDPHKYAASWEVLSPTEVSLQIARDGVIVSSQVYEGDTSLISLWDKVSVGSRFGTNVAASLLVKGLAIYPRAMPDAELQALTS